MSTLDPQLSEEDVDQLLGELEAFNPPALNPAQALNENVVDQTAGQYQDGQSGDDGLEPTGPQTQSATQINTTIQILASSLLSNVGAAGGAGSSAAEALNQTLQGIWQLQIGCLFDCFLTQQTQQAEQSNTTIYVVPDAPATTTSTANTTIGLIWQLQVGCLFWCYDAVEVQTATSSNTTLVLVPVAAHTIRRLDSARAGRVSHRRRARARSARRAWRGRQPSARSRWTRSFLRRRLRSLPPLVRTGTAQSRARAAERSLVRRDSPAELQRH